MKKLLSIIVLCLAFIECGVASGQNPKSEYYDWYDINYPLNGNVQYIQQTSVRYIVNANEDVRKVDSWVYWIQFNANGDPTRVYDYDVSDGGSFKKRIYDKCKYDKHNNLILSLMYPFAPIKYAYNNKNQVISSKYLDTERKYVYNDKGYLESIFWYGKGELEPFRTEKYDEWGNIIEFNRKDTCIIKVNRKDTWEYKYGDNGRILESQKFDEDNKMVEHRKYQYDENGNEVRECCYDANGKHTKTIEKMYDQNNNLIAVKETEHEEDRVMLIINEIHYK